ncbi:MAG: phenylacetate--CoA ligase family protein [Candidatus Lindowbacteria bacterium]|nr:phenylacetate--CoA ligase family protein [Candidatus Lindowbacteria bacterium]
MISSWRRFSKRPWEEQSSIQDKLLTAYLKEDVAPFHAYYNKAFKENGVDFTHFKGVKDLKNLPFTTKADMIDAIDEDTTAFILKPTPEGIKEHWPLKRKAPLGLTKILGGSESAKRMIEKDFLPIFMTATTGRTTRPVPFMYSKTDVNRLRESGKRLAGIMGLTSKDRLLNVFPYAPHLAFWQVAFAGFEGGIFILSTGGGKTIGTAGNIRMLDRIQPSGMLGVPSYLYHVLRTAREQKVSLKNMKSIVLGAEKIADTLRDKLVELTIECGGEKPAVMGTYGFTEAKIAWTECPGGTGYHLYPDMGVVEIINPDTGEVLGEGESGEIVYTAIGARGTMVVRYRTGDYSEGGITHGPCPYCGLTVPRLNSRITRLTNQTDMRLTKVKGTLVDLNHIGAVLSGAREIEEWQVVLKKRNDDPHDVDEIVFYLAPATGMTIDVKAIENAVAEATEVKPAAIHIEDIEKIIERIGLETELKETRFLDTRPD